MDPDRFRVYRDNDITASKGLEREQYDQMMADVAAGVVPPLIVTVHTSRIWRDDLERAQAAKVLRKVQGRVVCVNGREFSFANASDRILSGVLGVFDAGESDVKGERIRDEAVQRAHDGRFHGGPIPYGWKRHAEIVDGQVVTRLVIEPDEAAIVREIYDRLVVKGHGLAGICTDLNRRGVKPRRAAQWRSANIRDMLTRPGVCGLRSYKGEIVGQAVWEPILTVEEWRAACAVLGDASRRTTTGNTVKRLAAGFLYCYACGSGMLGATAHGSHAERYHCPSPTVGGRPTCPRRVAIPLATVDRDLTDLVTRRLEGDEAGYPTTQTSSDLSARMETARGKINLLAKQWAAGTMSDAAYGAAVQAIEDQLARASKQAETEARRRIVVPPDIAVSEWLEGDLARRRTILTLLIDGVIVYPGRRGVRGEQTGRLFVVWRDHQAEQERGRRP